MSKGPKGCRRVTKPTSWWDWPGVKDRAYECDEVTHIPCGERLQSYSWKDDNDSIRLCDDCAAEMGWLW